MRCHECGYMNDNNIGECIKCGTKLQANLSSVDNNNSTGFGQPSTSKGEGAPTMRGKPSTQPAWDEGASPGFIPDVDASIIKCPSCGFYPLHSIPDTGNPCQNCGFSGESAAVENKSNTSVKTVQLKNLDIGSGKSSFTLIEDSTGSKNVFDGDAFIINRENIDGNSNSISSGEHAMITLRNGKWLMQDKSSNGATFKQVTGEVELVNGNKIIIGNKIFTVEIKKEDS